MVPDEEQAAQPEPVASDSPAPPRERGERGGRRRGGRRGGRRRGGQRPPPRPMDGPAESEPPVSGEAAPEQDYPAEQNLQEPAPRHEPSEVRETAAAMEHPRVPAVTQAIEQVNGVIEELKRALDEMEEVLETLELAERQKIDDEREIESLQRALRQLHRPRDSGPRR